MITRCLTDTYNLTSRGHLKTFSEKVLIFDNIFNLGYNFLSPKYITAKTNMYNINFL